MTKYIINADDFGQTLSCTKAIAEAMEKGLITDTTMVANGADEAFALAVELATESETFRNRVGIHLNLTEGKPLAESILSYPKFVTGGEFHGKINRFKPLSKGEKKAIYEELASQVKRLQESGVALSHADSHHHIHTAIFIAPIVMQVCRENGISKLRLHRNIGVTSKLKRIVKSIYNNAISKHFRTTDYFGSAEDMAIHTPNGIVEIMVHPDYNAKGELIDRVDYENGYPIGPLLKDAVGAFTDKVTNYEAI